MRAERALRNTQRITDLYKALEESSTYATAGYRVQNLHKRCRLNRQMPALLLTSMLPSTA